MITIQHYRRWNCAITLCLGISLLLITAVGAAEPIAKNAANKIAEQDVSSAVEQFIYSRECEVRLYREPGQPAVIPFSYNTRPTITVDICGASYQMLFDTGTQSCLLQPRAGESLPPQLVFSGNAPRLAHLEAKRAVGLDGTKQLEYAIAPSISCGEQVFLRDVPLRVYPSSSNTERDYSGAIPAIVFADYIVLVSNTGSLIELHDRKDWQPPEGSLMLPLVLLPRGYFVPARVAERQYLFHFDTGFSGGIGLTANAQANLANWLTPVSSQESFSGWHAELNLEAFSLSCPLELNPYPVEPWAQVNTLELTDLVAVDFEDSYSELEGEGYQIGGIIGSRVWGEYDYALDLRLQRLYILGPRK